MDGNTSHATAHFIAYGGGNALVLVDNANSPPQAASGGPPKQYISGKLSDLSLRICVVISVPQSHHIGSFSVSIVTLPEGVRPGDTIHVQSPDGRLNAIVVPDGMFPGSTFTVEFASAPKPPPTSVPAATGAAASTAVSDDFVSGFNNPYSSAPRAAPAAPAGGGGGFVAGFNNPNAAVKAEPDVDAGASYPTAPAYNPSYTSKPY